MITGRNTDPWMNPLEKPPHLDAVDPARVMWAFFTLVTVDRLIMKFNGSRQ